MLIRWRASDAIDGEGTRVTTDSCLACRRLHPFDQVVGVMFNHITARAVIGERPAFKVNESDHSTQ